MRKRRSPEQIAFSLRQAEAGVPVTAAERLNIGSHKRPVPGQDRRYLRACTSWRSRTIEFQSCPKRTKTSFETRSARREET